jgi:uncharacterized repeat protein (TIGR01451 family)
VINSATISGGGDLNTANNTASDPTTIIPAADLSLSMSHSGTFTQGRSGTYTITVMNNGGPTNGLVTVTSTLPSVFTATAISGSGWTCVVATLSCTRSDVLADKTTFPPITIQLNVATNAPASVISTASVSGGGDSNLADNTPSEIAGIASPPSLTLFPSSATVAYREDTYKIEVRADSPDQQWQASTAYPWIRLSSASSGRGSGTLSYTVTPNTGISDRTGSIVIDGLVFNSMSRKPMDSPRSH